MSKMDGYEPGKTPGPWGIDEASNENIPEVLAGAVSGGKKIAPPNVAKTPRSRDEIIKDYYEVVLKHVKRSFILAWTAAIVGSIFFLLAIVFFPIFRIQELSYISLISGAMIEFISAVNFYLYGRSARQLTTFHSRLEGVQSCIDVFNLADRVCDKIDGALQHEVRSVLVRKIADLPGVLSKHPITEDSALAAIETVAPAHANGRNPRKAMPAKKA